ncbi:phosphatidylinositol transfer protein PDR16 [Tribonema minus]|uniref:Phosphatidylinositol transfer protein PDR16 n=1 Tax=Tribonema minus TaxID=303371 RepID=A0A835Z4E3_9STRA|nr:phosphatidylinositol transfer protein PDR16 [Tribonema minus]
MAVADALDPRQEAALAEMRSQFAEQDGQGMDLDDQCLLRYLRARQYDLPKASAMLQHTLDWRRDFGVQKILSGDIMETIRRENATGKIYVRGEDTQGRVCLIMRPSQENTHMHDDQMKHLVYQMERARLTLQRKTSGMGKLCMVIDYAGYSLRNAPPMRTSRSTLNIVQDHYPELLGVSYMMNPPYIFTGFWKIIYPFIDHVTRQKFVFVNSSPHKPAAQANLAANFNMDALEEQLGGRNAVPFDSAVYLSGAIDTCFEESLARHQAAAAASTAEVSTSS